MGTHGSPPTRVLEVPVKWTRPASGPGDLIHSPGDLGSESASWPLIVLVIMTSAICGI
jgi:hypothetical protein